MAFVWGIDTAEEFDLSVTIRNNEATAQIAIGYDDETDNTISIFVAFSPLPSGEHEHIFGIVDADPRTPGRYEYWDGSDTMNLFNKEDREAVLGIVISATLELIRQMRPAEVRVFTHAANLPVKALQKFRLVMAAFASAGYQVSIIPPHNGRQGWAARLS